MLVTAILIGLVAAFGVFDYQLGTLYLFRPIVTGPIVGLILGDVQTGTIIGANLELLFMGAISVGAYIPPDVILGGVLGTAFAISLKQGAETALALAMPIALLSLAISNFLNAILPMFLKIADDSAARGSTKGIEAVHWGFGFTGVIEKFVLAFLSFYFGAEAMKHVIDKIPQVFIDGMSIAAGILPAMGFAMLMGMILNKKLVPFFFLGFVLSSYLKMPILGVAIVGIILIIEKFHLLDPQVAMANVSLNKEEDSDDDF